MLLNYFKLDKTISVNKTRLFSFKNQIHQVHFLCLNYDHHHEQLLHQDQLWYYHQLVHFHLKKKMYQNKA
jgi:hypothetical protein